MGKRNLKPIVFVLAVMGLVVGISSPANAQSEIDRRYSSDSSLRALLGSPVASEASSGGGKLRHYENGTLYYHPSAGVHEVHGQIREKFRAEGGLQVIGFPLTDQVAVNASSGNPLGLMNRFQNGTVVSDVDFEVLTEFRNSIAEKWLEYRDLLGIPRSDELPTASGVYVDFAGQGRIFASSSSGTHSVLKVDWSAGIAQTYGQLGGPYGFLRLPVTDFSYVGNPLDPEGTFQIFQGGRIYDRGFFFQDEVPGFEIHGSILARWLQEGGLNNLGYPTSNEQTVSTGKLSHFENGDIFYDAATNSTRVVR